MNPAPAAVTAVLRQLTDEQLAARLEQSNHAVHDLRVALSRVEADIDALAEGVMQQELVASIAHNPEANKTAADLRRKLSDAKSHRAKLQGDLANAKQLPALLLAEQKDRQSAVEGAGKTAIRERWMPREHELAEIAQAAIVDYCIARSMREGNLGPLNMDLRYLATDWLPGVTAALRAKYDHELSAAKAEAQQSQDEARAKAAKKAA